MAAAQPQAMTSQPFVNEATGGIWMDQGNLISDGAGNTTHVGITTSAGISAASETVTGAFLLTAKKIGAAVAGDLLDASGATQIRKLGPTSTKLQDSVAATTNNWTDSNNNQINSCSKMTGSTNAATAHNYAGGGTPTYIQGAITGTATAWSFGTVTATQATPAMTSAAAYTAYVALI